MRTKYLILISISSLILFGVVFYTIQSATQAQLLKTTEWSAPQATTKEIAASPPVPAGITVSIEGVGYAAAVRDDSSVLTVMQTLQTTGDFTFSGREYPALGFFVESINGKKNNDGYYWFLYVNGKESGKGASQTLLSTGDIVEWRYKKGY
jgi:hypothetical protein